MTYPAVKLLLPTLPVELYSTAIEQCKNVQVNQTRFDKIKNRYADDVTLASQQEISISDDLILMLRQIYGKIFEGGIVIDLSVIVPNGSVASAMPPHCDRHRRVNLLYPLSTGGPDVVTCFYKEHRPDTDLSTGINRLYSELNLECKIQLHANTWYAVDAQQFHSVENIIDNRCLLTMVLIYNPSYTDFIKQYKHLIDYSSLI
jgi:hypothetical protein